MRIKLNILTWNPKEASFWDEDENNEMELGTKDWLQEMKILRKVGLRDLVHYVQFLWDFGQNWKDYRLLSSTINESKDNRVIKNEVNWHLPHKSSLNQSTKGHYVRSSHLIPTNLTISIYSTCWVQWVTIGNNLRLQMRGCSTLSFQDSCRHSWRSSKRNRYH